MAIPAAFGCSFLKWKDTATSYFYVGLFSYKDQTTGTCMKISDTFEYPTSWTAARVMAILAIVGGIVALGFTLSLSCVSMPNIVLKTAAATYLMAGFLTLLTMLIFADCYNCALAPSGILAIIASIFYFITAAIVFNVPKYENDDVSAEGIATPQENVTVIVLPDGTKKTVKTILDQDGNKIIEETMEVPDDEDEVEVSYLPDGSIMTRRITYDDDGNKVIHKTIEKAQV